MEAFFGKRFINGKNENMKLKFLFKIKFYINHSKNNAKILEKINNTLLWVGRMFKDFQFGFSYYKKN